jgi:hypothetical protein
VTTQSVAGGYRKVGFGHKWRVMRRT